MRPPEDTTELLLALREGDSRALDRLVPRVYDELHRIARRIRRAKGDGDAPSTTALVHEAYLKLVDGARIDATDRARFLALAATAIRHLVIDDARRRLAAKRGGGRRRVPLDAIEPGPRARPLEVIRLHEALSGLERFDPPRR